jgi:hypothetical protein
MALLGAVYAVASLLPGFPMIGVPGSKIDIARSLEMGYGFVLGPFLGPLTSFLGAVIGKTLSGGGVGLFFTPLAIVSSFIAACLSRNRVYGLHGWKIASLVLGLLIMGWYLTPTGRAIPLYPVLHFGALGVILIFRDKLVENIRSENKMQLIKGVSLASFSSTVAGHMLGNLIFILLFTPNPLFFQTVFPISVIERLVLTAIGTIIAVPLIITIRQLYPEFLV